MKFGVMRSIGHNIADSLASGLGFMIGVYTTDIFDEAAKTPEGFIEVDFLTGATSGGQPSVSLARAINLYADALPALCEKQGIPASAFRQLTVRFFTSMLFERFIVTVEDKQGQRSIDEYAGSPGTRAKFLDPLGRVRSK